MVSEKTPGQAVSACRRSNGRAGVAGARIALAHEDNELTRSPLADQPTSLAVETTRGSDGATAVSPLPRPRTLTRRPTLQSTDSLEERSAAP